MKILFVINNFYTKGNGLCASARRTVKKLKERGLDVRILSAKNPDPNGEQPDYILDDYKMPIFNHLIKKQGYSFAKTNKRIAIDAINWADIIHLEEPFAIEMAVAKLAKNMNKPCTATYHLHPENLFATVHLDKTFLNGLTLKWWKKSCFDKCKIIQCPTENVKERLEANGFKSELRVISNGLVVEDLVNTNDTEVKKISDAKYTIITIGRYSVEKNLKTLLNAMKYSKHNKEIQLIFAGKGPQEKKLKKLANKLVKKGVLKYNPVFGFYPLDELQRLSRGSDLYIHLAYIEVEGLSCMEAVQTGLLPIIAKGKFSATSQFANDQNSTYTEKDPKDLASKIDYWLENGEKRKAEALKYKDLVYEYNIEYSIDALIEMFSDAIKM
ncbi:MAG: glycosyltransferase [Acholeplasmatales bacterium]|nr:glycosyltransferase [Acholeplasmatales bacterium]